MMYLYFRYRLSGYRIVVALHVTVLPAK